MEEINKSLQYQRDYQEKNRVRLTEQKQAYKDSRKEFFAAYQKQYRETHKKEIYAKHAERQRQRKVSVKDFLGGSCYCCGESNYKFLTIDHVTGSGAADRKMGIQNSHIYWFIWKMISTGKTKEEVNKFFALACFNCNSGKHDKKHCPHAEEVPWSHPEFPYKSVSFCG